MERSHRLEDASGRITLSLFPDVQAATWTEIEEIGVQAVRRLETPSAASMIVDLSHLTQMGSAPVALLVRLWKSCQKNDVPMVVVNQEDVIREVLEVAGLTKLWTICSSRDEALRRINAPLPPASERFTAIVAVISVLSVTGSLVCLLLHGRVADNRLLLLTQFACSVVLIVMGTVSTVRETLAWRITGVALIVCGFGLGTAGVILLA